MFKKIVALVLAPLASLLRTVGGAATRVWSYARLREAIHSAIDPTCVVLGPVRVEGTRAIAIGKNARIYPGVYLETQGEGRIDIGDNVVLSSGVHIVAFDHVVIHHNAMLGEYTSVRDANHRKSRTAMRTSGHDAAAIVIGRNVWIGRGVAILKGVSIGDNSIIAANAVVTHTVPADCCALGVPARIKVLT